MNCESDTPESSSTASAAAQSRGETLTQGVAILLAMMVVQRLVGFGRGVVFCRLLEPEAYGEWGLIFNFLLLAAPLAVLGLPGSFGRYLEHYRQRGSLRVFLVRTGLASLLFALATVVVVATHTQQFAELIFGRGDLTSLVVLVAVCLAAVILHHFLESLYMALRMTRVVSCMRFAQSLGFALLGVFLLVASEATSASIVIAYTASSLISAAGSLFALRGILDDQPEQSQPIGQRVFWGRLLPFTLWIWIINILTNLFAVADRWMIVHLGNLSEGAALAAVGYYQSGLILPLLLVSVADLLGSTITPHLARDWEAGRRQAVSDQVNLIFKLTSLAFLCGAVLVLLLAPWIFATLLGGKYEGGRAVLPWALSFCMFFGLFSIAESYLCCAEKARLGSLALLLGLGANLGLNALLVPRLGIIGAAIGTTYANAGVVAVTLIFCARAGMQVGSGIRTLLVATLAVGLGPVSSIIVLSCVLLAALFTDQIFTLSEKHLLLTAVRDQLAKARSWVQSRGLTGAA